jgi:hypothetical protein
MGAAAIKVPKMNASTILAYAKLAKTAFMVWCATVLVQRIAMPRRLKVSANEMANVIPASWAGMAVCATKHVQKLARSACSSTGRMIRACKCPPATAIKHAKVICGERIADHLVQRIATKAA